MFYGIQNSPNQGREQENPSIDYRYLSAGKKRYIAESDGRDRADKPHDTRGNDKSTGQLISTTENCTQPGIMAWEDEIYHEQSATIDQTNLVTSFKNWVLIIHSY